MRRFVFLVLVSALLASSAYGSGVGIDLSVRLSESRRTFTFIIEPRSSASHCDMLVYGGTARSRLNRDTPTAPLLLQLRGNGTRAVSRKINNISKLKRRTRSTQTFFFRARSVCSNGTELSDIVSVVASTSSSSGALSSGNWLADVRRKSLSQGLSLARVFPSLTFTAPVDLQNAGDGSGRLFVVEQAGRIFVLSNADSPERSVFLDIRSIVQSGGEQGLLGLAFHPDYASNRELFVHYSELGTGNTQIARYRTSAGDPNVVDSSTGEVLLEVEQPFANHNGGSITFGSDGFLYIALGDGGSGGDPQNNAQDRTSLLGKILRIDVDGGTPYAIPESNPFFGNTSGFREEIYAYGLRNPWRISFDRRTNRLFAGDVGQGDREEIDDIVIGGNYGWRLMEGSRCFNPSDCDRTGLIMPIAEHRRSDAQSITGGYVYRGQANRGLYGAYVYGDFITGKLWAIQYDGSQSNVRELFDTAVNISSFGESESKELYFLSYGEGAIYRFR